MYYKKMLILPIQYIEYVFSCADAENFVRGGSTFTVLFMMRGGRIKIPLIAGHHRPASETPFKWRFAIRPIMAHN